MYRIRFYRNGKGQESIRDYLEDLSGRGDKNSRIKLNKIHKYIQILSEYGVRAGEPYVKHIEGEIWELRPLRDRIFFFCWSGDCFVLLHYFMKRVKKRPPMKSSGLGIILIVF